MDEERDSLIDGSRENVQGWKHLNSKSKDEQKVKRRRQSKGRKGGKKESRKKRKEV